MVKNGFFIRVEDSRISNIEQMNKECRNKLEIGMMKFEISKIKVQSSNLNQTQ